MLKRITFTIAITLIFAGCGGDGGNNNTDTGETGKGGNGTVTVLEGTWIKSCGIGADQDSTDPDAFYDVITITFNGNNFDSSIENFTDAGCMSPFTPAPVLVNSHRTLFLKNFHTPLVTYHH